MISNILRVLSWFFIRLICVAIATDCLSLEPTLASRYATDGKSFEGYVGRITVGATFAPLPILPNLDYSLESPFKKSDFYFSELQKLALGKNVVVQLWPCQRGNMRPGLTTFEQVIVEIPTNSLDGLINQLWLADDYNSRMIAGSNFQGLGYIHHQIQGALIITRSKNGAQLAVNAKFKGVAKPAQDGLGKPSSPSMFDYKLEGLLAFENSIARMNEFTDCRGILGIKEPLPCKVGEACVITLY